MVYGKFIKNQYDRPCVGQNGRPLNFTVRWFDSKDELETAITTAWQQGGNGFGVKRTDVWGYFHPRPHCYPDGEVGFLADTAEEIDAREVERLTY